MFICGCLRVRQYHTLEVFTEVFFWNALALTGIDAPAKVAVPLVLLGDQRHKICLPVEMKRRVFKNNNKPKRRGLNILYFLHCGRNPLEIGKMQDPADSRMNRMHRPSRDKRCKKISCGFDVKSVSQQLELFRIILIKIQKRIFLVKIRQYKKVKVQRVVADNKPMHGKVPQYHCLLGWNDSKGGFTRFNTAQKMCV